MKKLLASLVFSFALLGFSVIVIAQEGIDPEFPASIENQNIWKIYTDYQIFMEEINRSVTRKNAGLLSHDATRWKSYITALRSYTDYWQSQSFLDYPVTHGRNWLLPEIVQPECDFKSNTAACELMALVKNAADELVLSASAKLPLHLYPQDLTRQQSYWSAMEGYIDFMATNSPLDEPVTSAEDRLGLEPGFELEPAQ